VDARGWGQTEHFTILSYTYRRLSIFHISFVFLLYFIPHVLFPLFSHAISFGHLSALIRAVSPFPCTPGQFAYFQYSLI
jgi:hypothetical protein